MKIIGRLADENIDFHAKKPLLKKRIFHISNAEDCTANKLMRHLKNYGINVYSIHPIIKTEIKQQLPLDTDYSNHVSPSYRLCIIKSDTNKLLNPNLWPSSVVVQEWIFAKPVPDLNLIPTTNHTTENKNVINNSQVIDINKPSTSNDGMQ